MLETRPSFSPAIRSCSRFNQLKLPISNAAPLMNAAPANTGGVQVVGPAVDITLGSGKTDFLKPIVLSFDLSGAALATIQSVNPGLVKAHFHLGLCLGGTGDADGAMRSYREAIRLDPTHAPSHTNLGFELLRLGDVPLIGAPVGLVTRT